MAKFYGPIGFGLTEQKEISPGVWETNPVEKNVYGDIIRLNRRLENSDNLNDNINLSVQISIIADPWIQDNIYEIKYIVYKNKKWKVREVDASTPPRLLLILGGLYE
jgi:hypothetical protein